MRADPDPLDRVLRAMEVDRSALLGSGGEATVFALDDERVVRVPHGAADAAEADARQRLVDALGRDGAPFLLPRLLERRTVEGRLVTVERRLPGRTVAQALRTAEGPDRDALIEAHLEAAAALGDLRLDDPGWFGELLGDPPLRRSTWHGYLETRAAQSLQRSSPDLHGIDAASLVRELPDVAVPSFVHLDAFAGNVLTDAGRITAVLDFGLSSLAGDRRFDPVASAVYLVSQPAAGVPRPRDRQVVESWLRAAGLADLIEPVGRWLAAFWAFAVDDPALHAWCRSVLLDGAGPMLAEP